jgi:hypothetical protein
MLAERSDSSKSIKQCVQINHHTSKVNVCAAAKGLFIIILAKAAKVQTGDWASCKEDEAAAGTRMSYNHSMHEMQGIGDANSTLEHVGLMQRFTQKRKR